MKKYTQIPPFLLARATALWLTGRVHFPKDQIGITIKDQEDFIIFRKVVLDPSGIQPINPGAIFKVYFRFARFQ